MDKGPIFAIAVYKELLTMIDLSSTKHIVNWSDKGKHFLANRCIATLGVHVCGNCRHADSSAIEFSPFFGVAKHFKNPCDRECGLQNQWTNAVSKKRAITEISDQIQIWRDAAAHALKINPNAERRVFIEFEPPPRKDC